MQIYRQELLAIRHPPDKFCDHKYYDNEDLMFLICHVTSSEHMFKVLYEFTGGSPLPWVTTWPCLVAIGIVQVEI